MDKKMKDLMREKDTTNIKMRRKKPETNVIQHRTPSHNMKNRHKDRDPLIYRIEMVPSIDQSSLSVATFPLENCIIQNFDLKTRY